VRLTGTMGELLNLVGLSAGVVLYAMLLVMVVRAPSQPSSDHRLDRLPLITSLLGLAWNLCAILIYEPPTVGVLSEVRYPSLIGFSALGFLPAVVVHSVLRAGREQVRGAARTGLIATAYAVSLLATLLHIRAFWFGTPVPAVPGMRLLTYGFVALVLPVAIVARRQGHGRRSFWIAALAAFAVSALHLTQLHTGQDPWPVELLGHHASLPLALAILYQDYPFAFADLFLKRALTLLTLVAAAFLAIAGLGIPFQSANNLIIVGPREVGLVVTLWVVTALLFPRLHRGVSWFVDRVVLGRPDYRSLRATVTRRAQQHDQIAPLLEDFCDQVAPALSGQPARWEELPNQSTTSEAVVRSLVSVSSGVATIVIPTSDAPQYAVISGPLTGGRRFLSDDVSAFETMAVTMARRIDAIRLTQERYDRELRDQEIEKLATEAELKALRAQINPHFLFNALTTLGYLIQTAPPRALDTLMRLTTLLRSVLRSEGELTTLGRELEVVESYLDIERARFEDRLRVRIDVPTPLRSVQVPPLLLQPLVENAVKHGVAPQRQGGEVVVSAKLDDAGNSDQLILCINDTGVGSTDVALRRGRDLGVGLRNVERRLACHYGKRASLRISTAPGRGMSVEIRLPLVIPTLVDATPDSLGRVM
jgi:two-component system, LytTR family, sensor kinase